MTQTKKNDRTTIYNQKKKKKKLSTKKHTTKKTPKKTPKKKTKKEKTIKGTKIQDLQSYHKNTSTQKQEA